MDTCIYPVDFDNDDENTATLRIASGEGSDALLVWLRRVPFDVANVWLQAWFDAWLVARHTGPDALPHDGSRGPVCDEPECDREAERVVFDFTRDDEPSIWCDRHGI